MNKAFIIQLNEVNLEFLIKYSSKYNLKNISHALNLNLIETESENEYDNLEPWIQWTSFYTSKKFSDHNVFRLGDNENLDSSQFFDKILNSGKSLGCILPMNGGHSPNKASFYISDPWSNFSQVGSKFEKKLGSTLSKIVNDNNKSAFNLNDLIIFAAGVILKGYFFRNIKSYFSLLINSFKKPWYKAIFLDFFLANFHLRMHFKYKTDVSSIFLNCGAHIQHHYFLNSEFIDKNSEKNPNWYLNEKHDPLKDVMKMYDQILEKYLKQKNHKIFIISGLSQSPREKPVFYWRLNDHENFLKTIGIEFKKVLPRMTRDFIITFENLNNLDKGYDILKSLHDQNKNKLFDTLEKKMKDFSIFATLSYSLPTEGKYFFKEDKKIHLKEHLNFVAIKNGNHNSRGFCISNSEILKNEENTYIWDLSKLILKAIS
tara:strand:- start:188 stop:1477 length:1290 start_codon:yes stop_codon:yes gene_type:complete